MKNEDLENLCDDYKNKPYKIYGQNLPMDFWDLMTNTDKWVPFPFSKGDRYIDFARGIKAITKKQPEHYNKENHSETTSFVSLKRKEKVPFRHDIDFFPWTAYLCNGTFRYAQAETTANGIIDSKTSLFIKNNYTFEIHAIKNDAYECGVTFMSREFRSDLPEGLQLRISQYSEFISIALHDLKDTLKRGYIDSTEIPIVEMVFKKMYKQHLKGLESSKEKLGNLQEIRNIFSNDILTKHSHIYDIAREKEIPLKNNGENMTFDEAVKLINYIRH